MSNLSELGFRYRHSNLQDGDVVVEWGDGHKSRYGAKYLRVNCACAECIEEIVELDRQYRFGVGQGNQFNSCFDHHAQRALGADD